MFFCKLMVSLVKVMDLESHRPALIMAGLVCLLIVIVAMIASVWPNQEEWFFELGLLGKDKIADEYFVDVHSVVDVGEVNSWFIYVHNHMGDVEAVSIRVKLLNSTMDLPEDQKLQPTQTESFAEVPLSLSVNEIVFVPFTWSILEAENQDDSTVIKRLMVNEKPVEVDVSISTNSSSWMVFELWVQDHNSGEYTFGWESNKGVFFASVYIGFRVI